ncbi:MAG: head GIN domain-containing protein [Pyrinomonadaceae bacterium]
MKKIGLIAFIGALILGIVIASFISFGKLSVNIASFGNGLKGSGNVKTEKREVSGFKAVEVDGIFQAEITAGKDFDVQIEAEDNLLPFISVAVKNNVLKIETERRISPQKPLIIKIFAPNIESIETSGAAKVNLNELNNDQLTLNSSGASYISLSGATKNLNVDISGASRLDADDLRSENAEVEASGASRINIFASNELEVEASGASQVLYSGKPKELKKNVSGASCVREK